MKKEEKIKFWLQGVGFFIAVIVLIVALIFLFKCPSWSYFSTVIAMLLAVVGFLGYFAINYESFVFRQNKDSLIHAKLLEQDSEERRNMFTALRQGIKRGDQICILGTGVTSFLGDEDNLQSYLKNGAQINVLLINNVLLKTDRTCQGDEVIRKLLEQAKNSTHINRVVGNEFLCDIEKCHFLIQQQHFNHYFKRADYHEKVQDSYKTILKMKKLKEQNNWSGNIDAKHFSSFFPLSMTVVNPNRDSEMRMIIEFVLPFTEQRLLLQYPQSKGDVQLFKLFLDFFNDTWNKHSKNIS